MVGRPESVVPINLEAWENGRQCLLCLRCEQMARSGLRSGIAGHYDVER